MGTLGQQLKGEVDPTKGTRRQRRRGEEDTLRKAATTLDSDDSVFPTRLTSFRYQGWAEGARMQG
eukprot:3924643-Pyramimonas_sp.AAC.1